ncbi:MAG: LuxR C-terminal-related transcriptional regulator [Bacillota bacterium]
MKTYKLVPAELPEICAPRLELLGRFDKAAARQCIYISAPAGCGKTVSTRLWMQKSGRTPIWLGLDMYDNTPAAFYRFFCTALFSVIPQDESLTKIVKDPSFNISPVEYTIEILSRLSFDERKFALVLDDFHLITDEEILKSFIYVVKRLPLSVSVLILSRNEMPRVFSTLEESGRVAFIKASDLAFKSDEIRRYFASYGRFITAEEAREIFSLTEGWAIAVNALVLSGNITTSEKLTGNPLEKYIKTQIWDKLDDSLRNFMMQTSVVDEFTEELCGKITGNPRSPQILKTLCSGNLFISWQEGGYRFHHLFLDFLRTEASKDATIKQKTLYQRAAEYYLDQGDYFNALRYFLKSGDSRGIASAFYNYLEYNGQSSADMAKIYFINELPAEVLEENPFLYISCAFCSFLFGDVKSMYYYFDRIYERVHDIERKNKAFMEGVLILFAIDPRYSFMEQMARFQTGIAHEAENRNIPKALRSLGHNLPSFHNKTFRDFSHYALDMEKSFAEFRLMFFALLGSDYNIIASGVKSGLLYEKNLLKEAAALVDPNPETDSAELVFLSKMQLAAILLAMGKLEEAARCRAEIKSFLERENTLYLLPVLSGYETRIRLMDGDKAAAKAWLDNYFVTEARNLELYKTFLHFTTVRAYIVLGEFEKAQRLCEELKKLTEDFYRILDATEATALLVILKWMTGKKQEAAAMLQASLAEMERYHFIRVFADEGKAILPVLKVLLKKSEKENGPRKPGYRYLQEVYLAACEQSRRHKGIACAAVLKSVKLSRQQKLVLELLAKGYRNAGIVELTGLSINTIRYHTKIAYQKLEVNNATDAVLRARELKLID